MDKQIDMTGASLKLINRRRRYAQVLSRFFGDDNHYGAGSSRLFRKRDWELWYVQSQETTGHYVLAPRFFSINRG
ncbi:hypothetical protein DAA51_33250 [Bradyrhizobium sp. WBAH10]|nr:hypothetical protein [Bradyrhizobium sp. WBAH30]MDD1546056.1 hypothetical protein [Bradyrhizobium sp. WBAH41]MDD1559258.1 hypothetical protein [Bradyrhizobium sp. WBAH23]MDD1566773.1 hypothetical protein [Bradyrhizobium sp. WBAH33]MDD1592649.1 hypothetical protein [Bradyrhizobium sp. WBAH42]NRB90181.1 hypothetical protein [Bradyrhizobium sp. WBAH10]QCJ92847.1 hypothetical protein DAA57_33495 [Bradyrhizobium yuanmingense]